MTEFERTLFLIDNHVRWAWAHIQLFMMSYGFIFMGLLVFILLGYTSYEFMTSSIDMPLFLLLRFIGGVVAFCVYLHYATERVLFLREVWQDEHGD